MKKPIKHVRHQAKKHHEEHQHLKRLLSKELYSERLLIIFLGTFMMAISTVIIFLNWPRITAWFEPKPASEEEIAQMETRSTIKSFEIGMHTGLLVNGQTINDDLRRISRIHSTSFQLGVETSGSLNRTDDQNEDQTSSSILNGITFGQILGDGAHLMMGRTQAGKTLLKSLVASYYFGTKVSEARSTIEKDAELLSKINNTLRVDLFAYLNQSTSRADTLDGFVRLLETLAKQAQARSDELKSQVNFLSSNFKAQENTVGTTEDEFFRNLEIFDGQDADKTLTQFIGLQQQQSELKAKVGAYKKLQDYYDFFLPRLATMIKAIEANREPLIAGVKVVEIQNMTLPLIIQED